MKLPDVASLMREKTVPIFSNIPALKLDRFFTGIAVEVTAAIFWLKVANAAIFPLKRR